MPEMTFQEIGTELGITPEEARRIYLRAIIKLRAFLRRRPAQVEEIYMLLDENSEMYPRGANTQKSAVLRGLQNTLDCGFEWEDKNEVDC